MSVLCPCREPHEIDPASAPTLLNRPECYFSVDALLFCPQCRAVRCPYCTEVEPISWYCQQCLMETTKAGARSSGNRCMRNCLQCPRCGSNAVPKANKDSALQDVHCARCDWQFVGKLKRPSREATLAAQVAALARGPFSDVLDTVSRNLPRKDTARAPSTDTDRISSIKPTFASPPPSSSHPVSQEQSMIEAAASDSIATMAPTDTVTTSIVATSTATPADNQANDEGLPLLTPLRAKLEKRCRVCATVLANPVPNPSQSQFLTKHLARSELPRVSWHEVNGRQVLLLRSAASTTPMHVQLASYDEGVSIAASEVKIPPRSAAGFPGPLFLVERESPGSRQAFMAKASQKEGPGWAVVDIEGAERANITLFARVDTKSGAEPLGAWIQVRVKGEASPL